MRHLCDTCARLRIDENAIQELKSNPLNSINEIPIGSHVESLELLKSSANGSGGTKACHLCALLLQSLINYRVAGTSSEESSLPNGKVLIILRVYLSVPQLIANVGGYQGHPLVLSFGDGMYPLLSSV
jgi:hypothetical protein